MSGPAFRVLYIDDDAGLCRMVQRHFERNGLAVETAIDGKAGLEILPAIAALDDAPPVVYVTGEAEEELRASRDRFEALAAERALLIHEINHRVANNPQLASAFLGIQQSASSSPDVKAALSNAIARVAAIGHVHRQLYAAADVSSADLAHYLRHLTGDLALMAVE